MSPLASFEGPDCIGKRKYGDQVAIPHLRILTDAYNYLCLEIHKKYNIRAVYPYIIIINQYIPIPSTYM